MPILRMGADTALAPPAVSGPGSTLSIVTKLDPDTQTTISLIGTTERLAYEQGDRDAAIVELQAIAAGRTDLLSEAAGHFLGGKNWNGPVCHQLLVDAGADPEATAAAAERTRHNLERQGHTTAGFRDT